MEKENNWENNLQDLCWENFTATGEIGYYLLYKNLKREENVQRKDNKSNSHKSDELSRER